MRVLILLLAALGSLGAQSRFQLQALGMAPCEVEVLALDAARGFAFRSTDREFTLPFDQVISLLGASRPGDSAGSKVRARLWDGSELHGTPLGGIHDGFEFEVRGLGVVPIVLDHLARLSLGAESGTAQEDAARAQASDADDVLELSRNGARDSLPGELLAVSRGGLRFRSAAGERTWDLQRDGVLAVRLRRSEAPPREAGSAAWIRLREGSRVLALLSGPALKVRLLGGVDAELDLKQVASIEPMSSRFARLSELPAESVRFSPYLEGSRMEPMSIDCALKGGLPLASAAQSWRRGLALRAGTAVTWALDPRWKRLRMQAGIPASAQGTGSVSLSVLADGQVLWTQTLRAAQDAPVDVMLPSGTRTLQVRVSHADSLATGASAVLGDPLLLDS